MRIDQLRFRALPKGVAHQPPAPMRRTLKLRTWISNQLRSGVFPRAIWREFRFSVDNLCTAFKRAGPKCAHDSEQMNAGTEEFGRDGH
jgi:hypothetical protein